MALLPTYICHRTLGTITIDGKLDEPAWQAAEPVSLVLTDTGMPPRFSTTAKMLWDDGYFYVGFHCIDPDIWGTIAAHNGPMYNEEVVEVFIDADGDEIGYVEFEVNPLNADLTVYLLNQGSVRKSLWDWQSQGWQHAVTVDGKLNQRNGQDRAWAVEIAIPFADILTAPHVLPQKGDIWRVNLYRIDRHSEGDEFSAWSPTGAIDYHRPARFGQVVFEG